MSGQLLAQEFVLVTSLLGAMALTREQWYEHCRILAEQGACLSCYATFFKPFLTKHTGFQTVAACVVLCRYDYKVLLAIAKDCRCDLASTTDESEDEGLA